MSKIILPEEVVNLIISFVYLKCVNYNKEVHIKNSISNNFCSEYCDVNYQNYINSLVLCI